MLSNFYSVVYFSIHRYEHGEFWPNLRESDFHYIGENFGEGYNFNVPLNKTGMTNADYIAIFQQVLLPMAYEVCNIIINNFLIVINRFNRYRLDDLDFDLNYLQES